MPFSMKLFSLLMLCGLLFSNSSHSQNLDTAKIMHHRGTVFSKGGVKLNKNALLSVLRTNEQSFELIRKANANLPAMHFFSYSGGLLVGWTIGTMVSGQDPVWE